MKKLFALMAVLLAVAMLAGCVGTTVVVNDCTCDGNHATQPTTPNVPVGKGAVKTGVSITTSVADSVDGKIAYDVTIAAVTINDDGVICACTIDSIPATVKVDENGNLVDLAESVPTKNELGADYGMVAWGGAIAEWDAQVKALCDFAIGKTVAELKNGAIDETGKAPEGSDLASSATIYLGGFVSAIESAAANAKHLGAKNGDKLIIATNNKVSASVSATAEADGLAQLDADIAVVTEKDGKITSCIIDSVQAKIGFDATGKITSDLTAPIKTKNELGADYGMVAWGGAIAEWNEQAAAFAQYVTGKTAAEVAGIAITETTKPADGSDLASSVTIAIGGFQALIAKALA